MAVIARWLVCIWAFTPYLSFAQTEVADTVKPSVQLDEVLVVDQSAPQSELGFYQSTRQNGIENIIERMPGLSLIRRGNYAPDVVVHGMRNEQVGITIDGMQVFGACTDRMDPITSYVETNNLEEVNSTSSGVNKGCHSANIAGGLDLKLKDPYFGGGWGGMAGGGYVANGNGYNGLLNLNYGNQKFAANINSVYRKQSNYTDGNGQEVLYSQFEKINLAANFRYRISPNNVLRLSLIEDDAYNIGYAALPMDVAFAKASLVGLTSTWYFNGFFEEVSAKAYYNYINHAMDDSQRPDVPIRMDMPGTSHTLGGFVDANIRVLKGHHI